MAVDSNRRSAKMARKNSLSPEETKAVNAYLEKCVFQLSVSDSTLASLLANTMRRIITDAIDTMCVMVDSDAFVAFCANGPFTQALRDEPDADPTQGRFVLAHEAYHLLLMHLYANEHRQDEVWNMACEASINRRVCRLLGMDLPVINGEPSGVDPKKVYDSYRRDLRKQGLDYVDIDKFYETDKGCYMELSRMSRPPTPPRGSNLICVHGPGGPGLPGADGTCSCPTPDDQSSDGQQDGKSGSGQGEGDGDEQDGQSGSGGGSGTQQGSGQQPQQGKGGSGRPDPDCPVHGDSAGIGQLDQTEVGRMVDEALQHTLTEALNGDKNARKELTDLADSAIDSESASTMFGNLGLGALRGETISTKRTNFWQQWVEQKLAERLEPGMRLTRRRKITWEEQYAYIGDEPSMLMDVYVDASGSMRTSDLEWIAEKVGLTDGLEIRWHSFDADIWDFEVGEPIRGGGGTSFSIIQDHQSEMRDEEADAVLVVTDGYAPHITPDDPDKWVWLITPGGDSWPETHDVPMDCWEIDTST